MHPSSPTRFVASMLLALLFLFLSACGASALSTQADLVAVGGLLAADADVVLVDARQRELDDVLERTRAECRSGCDDARKVELRAEVASIRDRWSPVLECRAPVVEALRLWADGVEVAAAAGDIGLELLARRALRFLTAWETLDACLGAAAPSVDLPDLPPLLRALAPAGDGQ